MATVSELRALLRDDDEEVFTDEALEVALAASGDNVQRAAGIAFSSLAAEYALAGKSLKVDDIAIDTRGRGEDLLQVAKSFFVGATAAEGAADFFGIVPLAVPTAHSFSAPEGTPRPLAYGGLL